MKMDPIPQHNPTTLDLALRINQVHECLEDSKRTTKQNFAVLKAQNTTARADRKVMGDEVSTLKGHVETIQLDIAALKTGLGIGEGQKKTVATSTGMQSWLRTFGATMAALAGAVFGLRVAVAIWPATWKFLEAIYHLALTGHF